MQTESKTFSFQHFLREEEVRKAFAKHTEDGIPVGVSEEIPFDTLIECMDTYCFRLDNELDEEQEKNGITSYACELIDNRGITWSEFQDVFDLEFDPSDYDEIPAFYILDIQTPSEHKRFISRNTNTQNTYMYLLKKYRPGLMGYLNQHKEVRKIPPSELFMHCHIIGATGSLKSGGIIRHMFYDIQKNYNYGQIVFDWHSDLAKGLFHSHLNDAQRDRIIYIDPTLKDDYAPTINPLLCTDKSRRTVSFVTDQLIATFHEIFDAASESKMSEIMVGMLEHCVYFLLSREKVSTMYDLRDLLECSPHLLLEAQSNPAYAKYFDKEFQKASNSTRIGLLIRTQKMLTNPLLGPLIGGHDTVNLEDALDTGKQVIVRLGALPVYAREAFGKIILAQVKSIMWKREDRPEAERRKVFFYIDEFENFITHSVEQTLDELRKYGLHLILSHQHLAQIDNTKLASSVITNTNVKMVGKIGDDDATISKMSKMFRVEEEEIRSLKRGEFYIKYGSIKAFKITAPGDLFYDKSKTLPREKQLELEEYTIKRYYRKVEDHRTVSPILPPLPEP